MTAVNGIGFNEKVTITMTANNDVVINEEVFITNDDNDSNEMD